MHCETRFVLPPRGLLGQHCPPLSPQAAPAGSRRAAVSDRPFRSDRPFPSAANCAKG
ncbi:hypothetical protein HMPREF0262_02636 [Clostridium sp. ATCC 29733]|nr:hypothetical protein HMPREF0262_02636 [Clostridium sp. ATCC 29733]